jgi:hypothetical protein
MDLNGFMFFIIDSLKCITFGNILFSKFWKHHNLTIEVLTDLWALQKQSPTKGTCKRILI